MKSLFVVGIIFLIYGIFNIESHENIAVICILLSFVLIPISIILFVVKLFKKNNKTISQIAETTNNTDNIFNTYFIKASDYRNKDGKVERGNCVLEFDEETFYIKQNEEIIENPITSIYLFDIWEYEDRTYFKIQMRSRTEYMFSSNNNEEEEISSILEDYDIKIEDNR